MKANFNIRKNKEHENIKITNDEHDSPSNALTESEFEDFIIKSGAKGSFMIFRSSKKEDELGLDEL